MLYKCYIVYKFSYICCNCCKLICCCWICGWGCVIIGVGFCVVCCKINFSWCCNSWVCCCFCCCCCWSCSNCFCCWMSCVCFWSFKVVCCSCWVLLKWDMFIKGDFRVFLFIVFSKFIFFKFVKLLLLLKFVLFNNIVELLFELNWLLNDGLCFICFCRGIGLMKFLVLGFKRFSCLLNKLFLEVFVLDSIYCIIFRKDLRMLC